MKYRAVLHGVELGIGKLENVRLDEAAERPESVWVDDFNEAERIGKSGQEQFGASHYTIEEKKDDEINGSSSILKKVIELSESIPLGERDNWNQYFMAKAYIASLRSTCGSRRVGAVIVKDNREIASGYNGYPAGAPHCIDGGCPRFAAREQGLIKSGDYNDKYPCEAFHAEENAIYQCLQQGTSTKGTVIYSTTFPCRECAKKILGAGISKIFYVEGYPDDYSKEYLNRYGVEAIKVSI